MSVLGLDLFIMLTNTEHYASLLVGRSRDRFPVVDFFRGTPDRTMCPEVDSASES